MALRMAASVWSSLVLIMFVFPVLSHSSSITFTKDKLLYIKKCTSVNLFLICKMHTFYWTFNSEERQLYTNALKDASWKSRRCARQSPTTRILNPSAEYVPVECPLPYQQNWQNTLTHPDKQRFFQIRCAVFHSYMAQWHHTRQRVTSAGFPAVQSGLHCRVNGLFRLHRLECLWSCSC